MYWSKFSMDGKNILFAFFKFIYIESKLKKPWLNQFKMFYICIYLNK